jgi:hypothetical protein
MDSSEVIAAAKRTRADAMRRWMVALWRSAVGWRSGRRENAFAGGPARRARVG